MQGGGASGLMETRDRLLFAVPKKGRLSDPVLRLLEGAQLEFHRKSRLDIALCTNFPVGIVFLPAGDIARFVGEGNVDLGITGLDVIQESGMQTKVSILERLGFGKCRLCVQVPENSGIDNARDLIGRRIVTSFERLTGDFFSQLEDGNQETQISYISGSVEAACALGLADAIVDLVESGETMKAAKLVDIATIVESEAVLISNPRTKHPETVKTIVNRIKGVIAASRHVVVKYNVPRSRLKEATKITPGRRAPTVSPLEDDGWVAVESMISKSEQGNILDRLAECGASDILVLDIHNCRV